MFENADTLTQTIVDRIQDASGASVRANRMADPVQPDMVDVRLLALHPKREPSGANRPQVVLIDYLVTIRGEDALHEHRLAVDMLFALAGEAELEILDQPATAACTAIGIAPAAGFVVRGAVTRVPAARDIPIVRHPLVARASMLGFVQGTVLGPGDVPVSGALVSIAGAEGAAHTGQDGRFKIPSPPDAGETIRLKAQARGQEAETSVKDGELATLKLGMES